MIETSFGTLTDILRLLILPVFAVAAWKDIKTRRVPNVFWKYGLLGGSALLLVDIVQIAFESPSELIRYGALTVLSILIVGGGSLAFYHLGAFGGADAKAFITLAIWFPVFPSYTVSGTVYPLHQTLGVFSLTILVNTVLLSTLTPLGIIVINALQGQFTPRMVVGRTAWVSHLPEKHGRLLESRTGATTNGLDLDVLKQYLEWRGISITDLKLRSDQYELPTRYLPTQITDSSVESCLYPDVDAETRQQTRFPEKPTASIIGAERDYWDAERFFEESEQPTYGMTPNHLRDGLSVISSNQVVWYSPGIPYLVPMFLGLVISVVYGDLIHIVFDLFNLF